MSGRREQGFTLIELMVVVAIIGVLVAVAIPTYMHFTKTVKRGEAELNLDAIRKSLKAYVPEHAGFIAGSVGPTPAETCCDSGRADRKCEPDMEQWFGEDPAEPSIWDLLSFKIDEAHYFRYSYEGTVSAFTAHAIADIDCDGEAVTYTLTGTHTGAITSYELTKPVKID